MLINEIGVTDEPVELDRHRHEPTTDPKARETLTDILSDALRNFDTPPAPPPSPASPISSFSTPAPSRAGAGTAA